jgi:hypothetical protein
MPRNMHALRKSFDASVAASTQVREVDAAVIQAGRVIADRIDAAKAESEGSDLTKSLYLMPHLVNILRELLATPNARANVGLKETPEATGKLSQLRARATG